MRRETLHKMGVICGVIIVLLVPLLVIRPVITGFFFTPANIIESDIILASGETIDLQQVPNDLKYFALSGEIMTGDDAVIYLTDGSRKFEVYSTNTYTDDKITGSAMSEGLVFSRKCKETCSINISQRSWKLLVEAEPSAKVKITEIIYK